MGFSDARWKLSDSSDILLGSGSIQNTNQPDLQMTQQGPNSGSEAQSAPSRIPLSHLKQIVTKHHYVECTPVRSYRRRQTMHKLQYQHVYKLIECIRPSQMTVILALYRQTSLKQTQNVNAYQMYVESRGVEKYK